MLLRRAGWEESLRSSMLLPGLLTCILTGCTAANAPSRSVVTSTSRSDAGTILSVRLVRGQHVQEPQLAAFLADNGADKRMPDLSLAEFIVRSDTGTVISVVQDNAAVLRAGDRVVILHEGETRLAPSS